MSANAAGVVVEVAEVIALVYLMWVVGELAATLRDHLDGHLRTPNDDREE